jgi:GNAT superfamily N-acetyltransferase
MIGGAMHASPELLAALVIRPAARDDVRAVVGLYADDALGATREDVAFADAAPYLDAFDDIDADPRCTLYVAELDGAVVGTFQLTFLRHLTFRGARLAVIEAVHVARARRGGGIGEAMMRFAIDEARRRGCNRVQLTSHRDRTDAHRFYERLGFVASHVGMKMRLSP